MHMKWSFNWDVYWKIRLDGVILHITYFSSICLESEGVYIALTSSSTLKKNNIIHVDNKNHLFQN